MFTTHPVFSLTLPCLIVLAPLPDTDFYPSEQSLADELAAPTPGLFTDQPLPECAAHEFELVYGWFIS
jgi:hypothetical protein